MSAIIPLTRGLFTVVDDDDYAKYGKLKWFANWVPSPRAFYAVRNRTRGSGRSGLVGIHRLICGDPVGMVVDHINHDTLDNRRANLRVCTHAENCRNQNGAKSDSLSGIRGVYLEKRTGKWGARIFVGGKNISLGCFSDKNDAIAARVAGSIKHFGEYCGNIRGAA